MLKVKVRKIGNSLGAILPGEVAARVRVKEGDSDPLAFLAELCAHIPDPHEKTAIYYGWSSTRSRGFRKAHGLHSLSMPAQPAPQADRAPLALRRTWARMIRKIDEVDPLLCSRWGATMKVLAVSEDEEVF